MEVSRNAPCPCGSGKRYKYCHGVLEAPGGADGAARQRRAVLDEALAAQKAGRLYEALAKYESVVAEEPSNFDALHMLGVVYLQLHRLDRAELLIARALAVRNDASAKYNLDLVAHYRQREAGERALCREVVHRLQHLVAPARSFATWLHAPRGVLHVVLAEWEPEATSAIAQWLDRIVPREVTTRTWVANGDLAVLFPESPPLDDAALSEDDLVMVVGTAARTGDWTLRAVCATRLLAVTRDEPGEWLDALRWLSGEGRSKVVPCFVDANLRDAYALAWATLDDLAHETAVDLSCA